MSWGDPCPFAELNGKTILQILGRGGGEVYFVTDAGTYRMHHDQNCCESVELNDVVGDPQALIGAVVVSAEEPSSEGVEKRGEWDESFTWTFYKITTAKGDITLRWYGASNGYSESVDFERFSDPDDIPGDATPLAEGS